MREEGAECARFNPLAYGRQLCFPESRIMDEFLFLDRVGDLLLEMVLFNEIHIIAEWDGKARGYLQFRIPRMHQLAKVGRFRTESARIPRALISQVCQRPIG